MQLLHQVKKTANLRPLCTFSAYVNFFNFLPHVLNRALLGNGVLPYEVTLTHGN